MSRQRSDSIEMEGKTPIDAESVAGFLCAHPSFLATFLDQNPYLIHDMLTSAPPRPDGMPDLRDFINERLRSETSTLRQRLQDIVAISRNNLTAQSRTHSAALAILASPSLKELLHFVSKDMATLLDVDIITLCVENERNGALRLDFPGLHLVSAGAIDRAMGQSLDFILESWRVGNPMFFGEAAGIVRSQALIRLSIHPRFAQALLAIGSRRGDQFDEEQGTELLSFLGALLEIRIGDLLENKQD